MASGRWDKMPSKSYAFWSSDEVPPVAVLMRGLSWELFLCRSGLAVGSEGVAAFGRWVSAPQEGAGPKTTDAGACMVAVAGNAPDCQSQKQYCRNKEKTQRMIAIYRSMREAK